MRKPLRSESNPARILIFDDEHDERCLLDGITTYLTHSGYIVMQCQSAESAAERLQEDGAIDLMISDVALEDSSGVEVCLRLQSSAPELKLLFTSECHLTEWSDWAAARYRELPSDSVRFLQKPFSALDLLLRVDELIGAAPDAGRPTQARAIA